MDRAFERAARELARAAVSSHPQPEELVAFQEGRLAEADAARVRRHLLVCPDCAEEMDQLGRFDQEPGLDDELLPTPAETEADWAAFQQLLGREEPATAAAAVSEPPAIGAAVPARAPIPRRWWEPWLLAASVIFAVTGFSFWLANFGGRAAAPIPGPAASAENPFLVALLPDGEDLLRDAADGREIELPPDVDLLILRLHLGDQTPYPAYRADLLDAAGARTPVRPRLRRQPAGHFLALLDPASLPAGRYRLELVAVGDRGDRSLATYSFELREPKTE